MLNPSYLLGYRHNPSAPIYFPPTATCSATARTSPRAIDVVLWDAVSVVKGSPLRLDIGAKRQALRALRGSKRCSDGALRPRRGVVGRARRRRRSAAGDPPRGPRPSRSPPTTRADWASCRRKPPGTKPRSCSLAVSRGQAAASAIPILSKTSR
jgi:hypothetical protein